MRLCLEPFSHHSGMRSSLHSKMRRELLGLKPGRPTKSWTGKKLRCLFMLRTPNTSTTFKPKRARKLLTTKSWLAKLPKGVSSTCVLSLVLANPPRSISPKHKASPMLLLLVVVLGLASLRSLPLSTSDSTSKSMTMVLLHWMPSLAH